MASFLSEDLEYVLSWRLTGEYKNNGETSSSFLESQKHWQRMSLAVDDDSSGKQNGNLFGRDTQVLSYADFGVLTKCKIAAVNSERDDRELGDCESCSPQTLTKLLGCVRKDTLNCAPRRT